MENKLSHEVLKRQAIFRMAVFFALMMVGGFVLGDLQRVIG